MLERPVPVQHVHAAVLAIHIHQSIFIAHRSVNTPLEPDSRPRDQFWRGPLMPLLRLGNLEDLILPQLLSQDLFAA